MFTRRQTWFPTFGQKNIALVYLISFISYFWFMGSNWVFFAQDYVSLSFISKVEMLAYVLGLLIEIPSGALADLLGRAKISGFGILLQAIGLLLFTLGALYPVLFVFGRVLLIVGLSLLSGSLEAFLYDSLKSAGLEEKYHTILARVLQANIAGAILSLSLGAFFWSLNKFIPFLLTIIAFGIAAFLCFFLSEPPRTHPVLSTKKFAVQSLSGFKILFTKKRVLYTLALAILGSGLPLSISGAIRLPLGERFGYNGGTLGYILAATLLAASLSVMYLNTIRKFFGDRKGFSLLFVLWFFAWNAAGEIQNSLVAGGSIFFLMAIMRNIAKGWISIYLNSHIESAHRATALSTLALLSQVPLLVALVAFSSVNTNYLHVTWFLRSVGFSFLLGLLFFNLAAYRQNKRERLH